MARKQKIAAGAKIVPHLWFVDQAVAAANFYVERAYAGPGGSPHTVPVRPRSRSADR